MQYRVIPEHDTWIPQEINLLLVCLPAKNMDDNIFIACILVFYSQLGVRCGSFDKKRLMMMMMMMMMMMAMMMMTTMMTTTTTMTMTMKMTMTMTRTRTRTRTMMMIMMMMMMMMMMVNATSWCRYTFCITGPLWGITDRFPAQRTSNAELL